MGLRSSPIKILEPHPFRIRERAILKACPSNSCITFTRQYFIWQLLFSIHVITAVDQQKNLKFNSKYSTTIEKLGN